MIDFVVCAGMAAMVLGILLGLAIVGEKLDQSYNEAERDAKEQPDEIE